MSYQRILIPLTLGFLTIQSVHATWSIAIAATVAADCPKIMKTGAMRIDPNAMGELEPATMQR